MALYCESCGTLIPEGHAFCPQCGTRAPNPSIRQNPRPAPHPPKAPPRPDGYIPPTPPQPPKRNKGMLAVMIVCLTLALILAVVLVFTLLRKGMEQVPPGTTSTTAPAIPSSSQASEPAPSTEPGTSAGAVQTLPTTTEPSAAETVPALDSSVLEEMARVYMTALIEGDLLTMDALDYSDVQSDFLVWYLDGATLEDALVQISEEMNRTLTTEEDLLECYHQWMRADTEAEHGRDYTLYFKTLEAKLLTGTERQLIIDKLYLGNTFWSGVSIGAYADLDAIEDVAVVSVRVSFDQEEWQHYELYFVKAWGAWWVMDNCQEELNQ